MPLPKTAFERRENKERKHSVYLIPSTELLFDTPHDNRDYWQDDDWRVGSYGNVPACRQAMQSGLPNQLAMDAYDKARQHTESMIEQYRLKPVRRRRLFDETGDDPDVDRYLLGDSRMWAYMRKSGKNRTLTVGLMLWMTCGNVESDFAENVASGVAMADMLSCAGYSVRVVGVHTAHFDGHIQGFIHDLSDYGKPIDEHALMAWGQSAACRHIGFNWMQHLYKPSESMGTGHQTPMEWLELAGIDIFLAKQWGKDEQNKYITKTLEKLQKEAA